MPTWTALVTIAGITAGLINFLSPANAQTKKDLPKVDGRLIVEDNAGLFGPDGIRKAKGILAEVRDHQQRQMEVITVRELSESKQKEIDKLTDAADRERFFTELTREEAKICQAMGVFVAIYRKPFHVKVLCDKETRNKGFSLADEQRIKDAFVEKLNEASKAEKEDEKQVLRDKGLLNAAECVRDTYKKIVR